MLIAYLRLVGFLGNSLTFFTVLIVQSYFCFVFNNAIVCLFCFAILKKKCFCCSLDDEVVVAVVMRIAVLFNIITNAKIDQNDLV